jgi:GH15 family glucan-1,4-alpha-glucosidase
MLGSKRLEDYALLGDMRTAALAGRNGAIEWYCAPRFDSGASFAALLGDEKNGLWRIAPVAAHSVRRRYRGETLILETLFESEEGVLRLIDFMPLDSTGPAIVRILEGLGGAVPCTMLLAPRPNYGELAPWTRRHGHAWTAVLAPDAFALYTSVACDDMDGSTQARFIVHAGERVTFTYEWFKPHYPPPDPIDPLAALARTEEAWRTWSAGIRYDGPWRDAVVRSAITLKALTYVHTGAMVAAPTTSLPENIGGDLNWDYRFCWLRDSAYAIDALLELGCTSEALAWRDWLLRVYAGRAPNLHIMYGIGGERLEAERVIPWLCGFAGSLPVRVANDAHDQFQLGVYGDFLGALDRANRAGIELTQEHWRMIAPLLDFIEATWRTPGNGIWETRGGGRQYVDSKVMAWVAIERALGIAERNGFEIDAAHRRRLGAVIRDEVLRAGFDPDRNTFTQYYGSRELDASLLQLPIFGFLPATDPRMLGTIAAIERELVVDGFVFRYSADIFTSDEATRENEGSFIICTFWLAMNYALAGRYDDAIATFERVLSIANDVGLLAEEYDVSRRMQVGNFPQGFSHVGLIWAALLLAQTCPERGGEGDSSAKILRTTR